MKKVAILLIALMVISVGFLSGCTEQTTDNPDNGGTTSSKLSSIEPSEMALQLSDFPQGYELQDRGEKLASDVDEFGIGLGWKKGYMSTFTKIGDNMFQVTRFEQSISIYPIENVSEVIALDICSEFESNESVMCEELSDPNLGEISRAFRLTVTEQDGSTNRYYRIEFIKMDVWEGLYIGGTVTDYEFLKDMAELAVNKIE